VRKGFSDAGGAERALGSGRMERTTGGRKR
jgi:hypothetical protein